VWCGGQHKESGLQQADGGPFHGVESWPEQTEGIVGSMGHIRVSKKTETRTEWHQKML
jgi:hypothetical protein